MSDRARRIGSIALALRAALTTRQGPNGRIVADTLMVVVVGWVSASVGPVVTILLMVWAAAGLAVWWRVRPRPGFGEPWRQVITLGRGGHGPTFIAKLGGLPPESIRIAITPVAVDDAGPGGKFFRQDWVDQPRKPKPERPGSSS